MSYTPVELRHVKVGRSLFGYNRATVEQLIEEVAQSFEATWRERGELADTVESLEKQIGELRGREHLLTQTLVAAEQAASDVRERARREAEVIVQEAHIEARSIGRSAHAERERLFVESKQIEGRLRAALGMMETEAVAVSAPAPAHEPEAVAGPEPGAEPVGWHVLVAPTEPAERPAPEPEPIVHVLPPAPELEPEPEAESEYGWARDDTREFEPVSGPPESEQDHHYDEPSRPVAEPAFDRITGGGSRDFDWGE
jgi:cell division initiation protein